MTQHSLRKAFQKYIGQNCVLNPVVMLLRNMQEPLLEGETRLSSDYICQHVNATVLDIREAIEEYVIGCELEGHSFMYSIDLGCLDLTLGTIESVNSYAFVYKNPQNILFTITVVMEMLNGSTSAVPNEVYKISTYASAHNQHV